MQTVDAHNCVRVGMCAKMLSIDELKKRCWLTFIQSLASVAETELQHLSYDALSEIIESTKCLVSSCVCFVQILSSNLLTASKGFAMRATPVLNRIRYRQSNILQ